MYYIGHDFSARFEFKLIKKPKESFSSTSIRELSLHLNHMQNTMKLVKGSSTKQVSRHQTPRIRQNKVNGGVLALAAWCSR